MINPECCSRRVLWMGLVALVMCSTVWAQVDAGEPPSVEGAASGSKDAPEKPKEKPDFPPFEEVSEKHEKVAGFFDLYFNEKKDHLLAVIPGSMLDKEFLLASSISGGSFLTGFTWDTQVVKWQRMDKKLVLIEPDLRYDPAEKSTVSDVVSRTYTDRIVFATPIVSMRGSDPVIDLDNVFKADRAGLSQMMGGGLDASLSRWAKRKGFEKNVELAVDLALMNGVQGGTRVRMHYSLSELPKTDFKSRPADDRIGYFMTAVKNWGKKHTDKTVFDRHVHRWHLRKADPTAKVSDVHPDDQIIYYIEKTVPIEFRRYVREGILMWNQAFEKAGLRNVMAARQQTDTNEFKDLDPEDVRYNFFRWIVSGRAFAMGPSRWNPRTGEILDADIVWDDSLIRSLLSQYARLSAKGPASAHDPRLNEFLNRFPEWGFTSLEEQMIPELAQYAGTSAGWEADVRRTLDGRGHFTCNMAEGLRHEMALAGFVMQAGGFEDLTEEFVGDFIRYVVAHEVGHTLGLRHNFKASSWKNVEELLAAHQSGEPTSGSVMDYNAAVYGSSKDKHPRFFSPAIGPYDVWAIEYGYREPGEEYKTEAEMLKAIASRGNEPGLAYATDFDTGFLAPDPLVNTWDNGADPLEYARYRMDLVRELQGTLLDWAVDDGESFSHLRQVFDGLLFEYSRAAQVASRVIGGQYCNRNHRGDADEKPPFEIVPAKQQHEALEFLVERVFSAEAFSFDPAVLNKLAPGRWRHWDTDSFDSMMEYPLHDRVAAVQAWALFQTLNPFTIARVYDAELKVPADEDALTVVDLVTKTAAAIWSELTEPAGSTSHTNRKPFISSIRRNLQRAHLQNLMNVLLSEPGRMMPADAHAVVRLTMKGLTQQIGRLLEGDKDGRLDAFTRAHLDEAKDRIDKALEAEFQL